MTMWDAVFGTVGGLTADQVYYLSATARGQASASPPYATGARVRGVGIALSQTHLRLIDWPNVLL